MMFTNNRTNEWIKHMNDNTERRDQNDEVILSLDVSDDALERVAGTSSEAAAMSFGNAPTVSILIMCCGNSNLR